MDRKRSALHRKGPIPVQISQMTSAALCLSVALQLPATPAPLTMDPDSLAALQQALQAFGEFQQPYSAPIDVNNPGEGVIDAAVEVSAGCVQDGPPVIILDDDAEQAPQRYLVLEAPWHELPTGALLLVSGNRASTIPAQESNPALLRAEGMLTFLDYLSLDVDWNALTAPGVGVQAAGIESDAFMQTFTASSKGGAVPEGALAAWEGMVPDLLLALWRRDGFARYRDDRLVLVDPHLYAEVATAFLQGNSMEGADTFHIYAVTAFGQILLCGENTSAQISIDPHSGHVSTESDVPDPADAAERNWKLAFLLEALDGPYLDVTDDDEQPLYSHARDRLGPLAPNEIYSFSPAVSEGGWNAAHLVKVDRLAELKALAATVTRAQSTQPDVSGG
ncbi:GAD-like domain-containing protein [Stenotrophomonas maltophilia]|uniref:GAD-like domain-containing protein n=1 Tax=Stenotrophomonas maltophilia TaxID=40324 RepID=UPI002556E450|nr:GAD-like domain-containing protein [Stenotrophomonas maltophilia]